MKSGRGRSACGTSSFVRAAEGLTPDAVLPASSFRRAGMEHRGCRLTLRRLWLATTSEPTIDSCRRRFFGTLPLAAGHVLGLTEGGHQRAPRGRVQRIFRYADFGNAHGEILGVEGGSEALEKTLGHGGTAAQDH